VARPRTVAQHDPGSVHEHAPARRVLGAVGITVAAAAVELAGSWSGRSLFLVADAVHLLSHVGIFAVLLAPRRWWHERWEDRTALAVLSLVTAIAVGITATSVYGLTRGIAEPPDPAMMLLSVFGLVANVTVAWLLTAPARRWWSFRAALAHELSDGALTVAGLVGAGAIAWFGWRWVDPVLSLTIGIWLSWWASRLLVRRLRHGAGTWAHDHHH
jgi:cobalt-zinc-cadmium efflux system protein